MKLIIQIPCFNERDYVRATIADLPRHIPGIDQIEVLVIDDGSTDGTHEVARAAGVHYIVRIKHNQGLAHAFARGVDAALALGADLLVNTDADNQYRGRDIAELVRPIVEGRADMVVGDRQTDTLKHLSLPRRWLQRWGSRLVRTVSGTEVADSPSGFRAFSRKAMTQLFVHNRFTYTIETIIQAGRTGLTIHNAKIATNPQTRESRLFKSVFQYLRRAGPTIFRAYAMYRPVQTFSYVAAILFLVGAVAVGRFLVLHWLTDVFALNEIPYPKHTILVACNHAGAVRTEGHGADGVSLAHRCACGLACSCVPEQGHTCIAATNDPGAVHAESQSRDHTPMHDGLKCQFSIQPSFV